MTLPAELRQAAGIMKAELEGQRLRVTLAPCQRGRAGNMIRVAEEQNPDWYRAFCLEYPSSRKRGRNKPDTLIKREATVRGLAELEQGEMNSIYAIRLFPHVVEHYLNHWRPTPAPTAKNGGAEERLPVPIYL